MTKEMQLYWEAYNELCSIEEIVSKSSNPLSGYEEEFIEGPILDIACGQSSYLLEYSKSGRQLFGVDNDSYQLEELRKKLASYTPSALDNLVLSESTLLRDELPVGVFSVVILSNILHFFQVEDCKRIIAQIMERTTTGSLVYVVVHSEEHYANDPNDPKRNAYFKHYFTQADLDVVFDSEVFSRIYAAKIDRKSSIKELLIKDRWLDKVLDHKGIQDPEQREFQKKHYLGENRESNLSCVYKRK